MAYRTRIYYADADKELMRDRWQAGESLHSIARLFDRYHPSMQRILAQTGGVRPPKRVSDFPLECVTRVPTGSDRYN